MYKFHLDDAELEALSKWIAEHNKVCPFYDDGTTISSKSGAIGGRLTYAFTPTSIGLVSKIECACGGKTDVTDYGSW